jgi:ferredoxin
MKVIVDVEKCIAAGQCVARADEVFDQNEETGLVVVLDENPDESQRASVAEAVLLCPAQAILIASD